jgi:hypothetical protein
MLVHKTISEKDLRGNFLVTDSVEELVEHFNTYAIKKFNLKREKSTLPENYLEKNINVFLGSFVKIFENLHKNLWHG